MKPLEIKNGIYSVGVVDWNLRDFHGYSTEKGTSFNAFLVKGEKTVLFDTVKADFAGQLIKNIKEIIDPINIDYIVVNHAEMDHSGALPVVIELIKPKKLICTKACKDALMAHFHRDDWPFEIIKEGDILDIGGKTIQFFGSAMIHWPESTVSYLREDKILISNDIFGQHWATSERFDDEVEPGELYYQATKYYANIFMPTSPAVRKFLDKLSKLNLQFDILAPDHGLIWRKNPSEIWKKYGSWAEGETKPKAVIIYDTMWGSTAKMAASVARGLSGGVVIKLCDLKNTHRSNVITEVLDAKAVILGSSLMNGGLLPRMADMLCYMKGLRPSHKIGAAFGSYGWSNTVVKLLNEAMEEMKFQIIGEGVSTQYVPDEGTLNQCLQLGEQVRESILNV
ncbi:MAG: flavodoxin domain-containing protein [candidate division Zixibacteria bacterium]|nr:flavodoxin domain-containing protein [candidate division Zixibacteria bacterium]